MRNSNIVMIVLVSIFMLFAGCSIPGVGDNTQQNGFFSGGSGGSTSSGGSGVDLTFAPENPPSKMYKGDPRTFGFIFTNHQEHDITDMRIKTKGFETSYVKGLNNNYNVQTIPKATTQSGAGVFTGLQVTGVSVDGFQEKYDFNPKFDYCYTAKTSFREQICVPSKKNTCDVKVDASQKQNGPLVVSADRVVNYQGGIRIDFTVTNKANGKVVNECFKDDDYANSFELEAKLGDSSGQCTAVSGQQIVNGKANFYCEFTRSMEDSYASQIVVGLDYKYQQSAEKKIQVVDLDYQG